MTRSSPVLARTRTPNSFEAASLSSYGSLRDARLRCISTESELWDGGTASGRSSFLRSPDFLYGLVEATTEIDARLHAELQDLLQTAFESWRSLVKNGCYGSFGAMVRSGSYANRPIVHLDSSDLETLSGLQLALVEKDRQIMAYERQVKSAITREREIACLCGSGVADLCHSSQERLLLHWAFAVFQQAIIQGRLSMQLDVSEENFRQSEESLYRSENRLCWMEARCQTLEESLKRSEEDRSALKDSVTKLEARRCTMLRDIAADSLEAVARRWIQNRLRVIMKLWSRLVANRVAFQGKTTASHRRLSIQTLLLVVVLWRSYCTSHQMCWRGFQSVAAILERASLENLLCSVLYVWARARDLRERAAQTLDPTVSSRAHQKLFMLTFVARWRDAVAKIKLRRRLATIIEIRRSSCSLLQVLSMWREACSLHERSVSSWQQIALCRVMPLLVHDRLKAWLAWVLSEWALTHRSQKWSGVAEDAVNELTVSLHQRWTNIASCLAEQHSARFLLLEIWLAWLRSDGLMQLAGDRFGKDLVRSHYRSELLSKQVQNLEILFEMQVWLQQLLHVWLHLSRTNRRVTRLDALVAAWSHHALLAAVWSEWYGISKCLGLHKVLTTSWHKRVRSKQETVSSQTLRWRKYQHLFKSISHWFLLLSRKKARKCQSFNAYREFVKDCAAHVLTEWHREASKAAEGRKVKKKHASIRYIAFLKYLSAELLAEWFRIASCAMQTKQARRKHVEFVCMADGRCWASVVLAKWYQRSSQARESQVRVALQASHESVHLSHMQIHDILVGVALARLLYTEVLSSWHAIVMVRRENWAQRSILREQHAKNIDSLAGISWQQILCFRVLAPWCQLRIQRVSSRRLRLSAIVKEWARLTSNGLWVAAMECAVRDAANKAHSRSIQISEELASAASIRFLAIDILSVWSYAAKNSARLGKSMQQVTYGELVCLRHISKHLILRAWRTWLFSCWSVRRSRQYATRLSWIRSCRRAFEILVTWRQQGLKFKCFTVLEVVLCSAQLRRKTFSSFFWWWWIVFKSRWCESSDRHLCRVESQRRRYLSRATALYVLNIWSNTSLRLRISRENQIRISAAVTRTIIAMVFLKWAKERRVPKYLHIADVGLSGGQLRRKVSMVLAVWLQTALRFNSLQNLVDSMVHSEALKVFSVIFGCWRFETQRLRLNRMAEADLDHAARFLQALLGKKRNGVLSVKVFYIWLYACSELRWSRETGALGDAAAFSHSILPQRFENWISRMNWDSLIGLVFFAWTQGRLELQCVLAASAISKEREHELQNHSCAVASWLAYKHHSRLQLARVVHAWSWEVSIGRIENEIGTILEQHALAPCRPTKELNLCEENAPREDDAELTVDTQGNKADDSPVARSLKQTPLVDLDKDARRCPGNCGFQVTWHKSHCCGMCAATPGKHGPKCDKRLFFEAPSAQQSQAIQPAVPVGKVEKPALEDASVQQPQAFQPAVPVGKVEMPKLEDRASELQQLDADIGQALRYADEVEGALCAPKPRSVDAENAVLKTWTCLAAQASRQKMAFALKAWSLLSRMAHLHSIWISFCNLRRAKNNLRRLFCQWRSWSKRTRIILRWSCYSSLLHAKCDFLKVFCAWRYVLEEEIVPERGEVCRSYTLLYARYNLLEVFCEWRYVFIKFTLLERNEVCNTYTLLYTKYNVLEVFCAWRYVLMEEIQPERDDICKSYTLLYARYNLLEVFCEWRYVLMKYTQAERNEVCKAYTLLYTKYNVLEVFCEWRYVLMRSIQAARNELSEVSPSRDTGANRSGSDAIDYLQHGGTHTSHVKWGSVVKLLLEVWRTKVTSACLQRIAEKQSRQRFVERQS